MGVQAVLAEETIVSTQLITLTHSLTHQKAIAMHKFKIDITLTES